MSARGSDFELSVLIWTGFSGKVSGMVKVGLKLMYAACCCSGRCADLMNAWLELMIPLPLCPYPYTPTPSFSVFYAISEGSRRAGNFFNFNNSSVVKLLFCTIFHKTHYVPCL